MSRQRSAIIINALLLVAFVIVALLYLPLNNARAPLHSLRTPLDNAIPLVPIFALPYLSFFFLIGLTLLFLFRNRTLFRQTVIAMIAVQLVSYAVFFLWQTHVDRPLVANTDIFSRLVRLIYAHDAPYNDFPSLHTALSAVCAFGWLRHHGKASYIFVAWAALIVLSTLFVKQHYVADVLGGGFLAIACFLSVSAIHSSKKNDRGT